jgi:hypothetical protein
MEWPDFWEVCVVMAKWRIRLAMGEEKKHIYGSMLAESFFIAWQDHLRELFWGSYWLGFTDKRN